MTWVLARTLQLPGMWRYTPAGNAIACYTYLADYQARLPDKGHVE